MATFIPNITDVFPEPYIYKPDLAFFDKMLQRKTALYEQGVAKAKNAFESVYYAQLSNKENIPIRDAYIKQARANLQKMAGMDFSQAQNVAAARGIFSPFWEDKFIVKDVELTKHYQNQAQILDGWKNSDDPKIRENYSGIAAQDLQDGLDVLINAKRTDEDFSKVEKRKATPFTNIEKFLEEAAGKDPEKLKIVWDETSPDGAYLVKITNGERSKKPFAIWAQSQIGNNFYEQFRVTGRVYKQELYRQHKKINPNATDEEINSKIADEHIEEIDQGYTKRRNQVLGEIARIDGIVNALPQTSDPALQSILKQYANERAELYGRLNEVDTEYKLTYTKDYKNQLRNNIITDPDGFFTTLSKQRTIDNWATGRSVITSREVRKNEAWFGAQELQINKARLVLETRKTEADISKTNAEIAKINAETQKILTSPNLPAGYSVNANGQIVDKNGNVVTSIDGVDPATGAKYIGLGAFNVLEQGTAADVFEKTQKQLFNTAYGTTFDKDGLLYFAKIGLNLTDEEIAALSSHYTSILNSDKFVAGGPKHDVLNDPKLKKQKDAIAKLSDALQNSKYLKDADMSTDPWDATLPGDMHQLLSQYVEGYIKDRMQEAKDKNIDFVLTDQEFKAFTNYSIAKANMDNYTANEENRKQLMNNYVKSNPNLVGKLFTKDNNGNYNLVTASYLAKDMPTLQVSEYNSPTKIDLSKEQVARLFIDGQLSQTHTTQLGAFITINGKNHYIHKVNGKEGWGIEGDWNSIYRKQLVPKYGESKDFLNQYKKVVNDVVPNLQYFSSMTAKQGAEFRLYFNKDKSNDYSFTVFDEALSQANSTMFIQNADGTVEPADTELISAIQKMFQGKEKKAEEYLESVTYTTVGDKKFNGKPYLSFELGALSEDLKLVTGGKYVKDLAKSKFILAINDEATGLNIKNLPANTGMYTYGNILRGKSIKSDPIMEASGFIFQLTPNKDGTDPNNPIEKVTLNLTYYERVNTTDPTTRQLKSELVQKTKSDRDYPLVGPNAKTPDEIYLDILNFYHELTVRNKSLQDAYIQQKNAVKQTNSGTNVNTKDYWNQLIKK